MVGFSKTGNTYMFMDYLKQFNNNIKTYKFNIKDEVNFDVSNYDLIIVGTNTWGDGKIPSNCKRFIIDNALKYRKIGLYLEQGIVSSLIFVELLTAFVRY